MRSYSNFNWCSGNLRRHESRLSLVTRFSKLNGISIYESNRFLCGVLESNFCATKETLHYVSELLHEDLEIVKSVLSEPIRLPVGLENIYQEKPRIDVLRYCEECAMSGFHSYLHEYTWLALCPFHGTGLKLQGTRNYSTKNTTLRCEALKSLMQSKSTHWPRCEPKRNIREHPAFEWLTEWLARTVKTAARYSSEIIWRSHQQPLPEVKTSGQVIGRLHALEPIPVGMKEIFSDVEEGWAADIEYFPQEARAELDCASQFGIHKLFELFKRITAYSGQPYRFALETRSRLADAAFQHPKCNCVWGRERQRFGDQWVRVYQNEWPQWSLSCPYAVLAEEVHLSVGERFEFLSPRRREIEQTNLVSSCRELLELGLIAVRPNTDISPWGHPYMDLNVWPMYEWIGCPWLNVVFDAAALFELRAVHSTYHELIRRIDDGEWPGYFEAPPVLLWLSKTEQGLVLIRWHRSSPLQAASTTNADV